MFDYIRYKQEVCNAVTEADIRKAVELCGGVCGETFVCWEGTPLETCMLEIIEGASVIDAVTILG